jgi:TonB family protein
VSLAHAAAAVFEGRNWRPATQGQKAVVVWWNRKVRFRPKAELDANKPPPNCVAAATDRVYEAELTDDIEWPRLLESAAPEYPRDALNERDSGRAGVRCVLDTCGRVRDCTVMFAPRTSFGQATQKAAMQRRYAPARKDGQPIAIEITIVSDFRGP